MHIFGVQTYCMEWHTWICKFVPQIQSRCARNVVPRPSCLRNEDWLAHRESLLCLQSIHQTALRQREVVGLPRTTQMLFAVYTHCTSPRCRCFFWAQWLEMEPINPPPHDGTLIREEDLRSGIPDVCDKIRHRLQTRWRGAFTFNIAKYSKLAFLTKNLLTEQFLAVFIFFVVAWLYATSYVFTNVIFSRCMALSFQRSSIIESFHITAVLKMAYFRHEQLIPLLHANETYILPPVLLQRVMEKLFFNDEFEEFSNKISVHWVSHYFPKLPKRDEFQFWIVRIFPAVPLRVIYSSFLFFVFFSLVFWDPDVTHDISLAHGSVVVPCCVYVEASVVTQPQPCFCIPARFSLIG